MHTISQGLKFLIRLIVIIGSSEFPFLSRVPPRSLCGFNELGYQSLVFLVLSTLFIIVILV